MRGAGRSLSMMGVERQAERSASAAFSGSVEGLNAGLESKRRERKGSAVRVIRSEWIRAKSAGVMEFGLAAERSSVIRRNRPSGACKRITCVSPPSSEPTTCF